MNDVIQLNQILRLTLLHSAYAMVMLGVGRAFLPARLRNGVFFLPLMGLGWSLAAMFSYHNQNLSFWGWFLDPAAEKNLTAILTSTLLASIAVTAIFTAQASFKRYSIWHILYFGLLATLFFFLALDEYISLHENFLYWRQGYLGLGGAVALFSLLFIRVGDKALRPLLLVFVIALGSLGFAGVLLDTFSNQHILELGALRLSSFACKGYLWGIRCRNYGYTEEMFELVGAGMMWLSVLGMLHHIVPPEQAQTRNRFVMAAGIGWALFLTGWLWIFPSIENLFSRPIMVRYDDLLIKGYTVSPEQLHAGSELDITLYIQAARNLQEDYSFSVHLYTQPDAASITQDDMLLGEFDYPSRAWIPGLPVRNRFHLKVPADLPAGASYHVVGMLWKDDPMQSLPALESDHAALLNRQIIILDSLPLLPDDGPPSPENSAYRFDAGFTLAGFEIPPGAQRGDVIIARFWWETENALDIPLTHFIHAINIDTDELFVFDHLPFAGRFPTQDWPAGMHIMDSWQIDLPETIPAGTYRIFTGLYDSYTIARMPVTDAEGQSVQDALILLGEIVIE